MLFWFSWTVSYLFKLQIFDSIESMSQIAYDLKQSLFTSLSSMSIVNFLSVNNVLQMRTHATFNFDWRSWNLQNTHSWIGWTRTQNYIKTHTFYNYLLSYLQHSFIRKIFRLFIKKTTFRSTLTPKNVMLSRKGNCLGRVWDFDFKCKYNFNNNRSMPFCICALCLYKILISWTEIIMREMSEIPEKGLLNNTFRHDRVGYEHIFVWAFTRSLAQREIVWEIIVGSAQQVVHKIDVRIST